MFGPRDIEDTHRKDEGRDWSDEATSQRNVWGPQEARRGKEVFLSQRQRKHGPADTLISNFLPSEL